MWATRRPKAPSRGRSRGRSSGLSRARSRTATTASRKTVSRKTVRWTMRSTLAKQARLRNHPAAHAHRGAPRAVATSHASTPAITKHCATVSGSGTFANQICGIETAVSAAAGRRAPQADQAQGREEGGHDERPLRRDEGMAQGGQDRKQRGEARGDRRVDDVRDQEAAGEPRIRRPVQGDAHPPLQVAGHAIPEQLGTAGARQLAQQRILELEPAMAGDLPAEVQIDGGIAGGHLGVIRWEEQRGAQQDPSRRRPWRAPAKPRGRRPTGRTRSPRPRAGTPPSPAGTSRARRAAAPTTPRRSRRASRGGTSARRARPRGPRGRAFPAAPRARPSRLRRGHGLPGCAAGTAFPAAPRARPSRLRRGHGLPGCAAGTAFPAAPRARPSRLRRGHGLPGCAAGTAFAALRTCMPPAAPRPRRPSSGPVPRNRRSAASPARPAPSPGRR